MNFVASQNTETLGWTAPDVKYNVQLVLRKYIQHAKNKPLMKNGPKVHHDKCSRPCEKHKKQQCVNFEQQKL